MNGIKCPQCGLVNFAAAEKCKRCQHDFSAPAAAEQSPAPELSINRDDVRDTPVEWRPSNVSYGPWLSLFAVFIGIRLLMDVYRVFSLLSMWASPAWLEVTQPTGPYYEPRAASLLYFELFGLICLICLALIVLAKFLTKSKSFPRWALILISVSVLFNTIDVLLTTSIAGTLTEQLRNAIAMPHAGQAARQIQESVPILWIQLVIALIIFLLWVLYLRTSEHVRLVFGK